MDNQMQACVRDQYGIADILSVEQIQIPTPAKGEVLIKVEAASLNAADWHLLTGTPYAGRLVFGLRAPKAPSPGSDVAGTVSAVGSGVSGFSVGDRVFGECRSGSCAEFVATKEKNLALIPDGVNYEAAAATPMAGLTALQGLQTHGRLKPNEEVLINGAAGGVGTFAVQIAKALGAHVTGVCSGRNVGMVARLGADEVIDYTVDDFATRENSFDLMLDNVGNRSAAERLRVLRPDARYVMVSGPKENAWLGPVVEMARSSMAFRRASQTFHQFTAAPNRDDLNQLGRMLADGQIVPEVQRTVGLDGVAEAMTEIGSGHTRAKILVIPKLGL